MPLRASSAALLLAALATACSSSSTSTPDEPDASPATDAGAPDHVTHADARPTDATHPSDHATPDASHTPDATSDHAAPDAPATDQASPDASEPADAPTDQASEASSAPPEAGDAPSLLDAPPAETSVPDAAADGNPPPPSDASSDGASQDGASFDGAAGDAGANVTCTFTRTLSTTGACAACTALAPTVVTQHDVPLYVEQTTTCQADNGGGEDTPSGYALVIRAHQVFPQYELPYSYCLGTTADDPGELISHVNDPQTDDVTSTFTGTITVAATLGSVALDGTASPSDLSYCPGIKFAHQCLHDTITCSGTGTALLTTCAAVNNCSANASCSNDTCTCNDGYAGDGKTCTLTNPCVVNNGGCGAETCVNNGGVAVCVSGDPCLTNNGGCGTGTCTDSGGTAVCTPANPCLTNNGGCRTLTCTNVGGAPVCG